MEQEQVTEAKKVWESVQHYTVKCVSCSKWRLIPTKEKYEEIRAKMEEQLFHCERAREWRPDISCEDEADIEQDDNFRWAMDIPRIPQTPSGWQRILRIRSEGCQKFADVHYVAPSNKRIRSSVELNRYITDNPEYQGVNPSQFSFQAPVPLNEKYVKRLAKRRAKCRAKRRAQSSPQDSVATPSEGAAKLDSSGGVEVKTSEVEALAQN